ncbi:sigma-54-dependent transcriptional regulator [Marinospirillum sp.]|uniref:sigma-54-dependent transcriptional regulator n=1 Tax=Marinospirillum sp. TaxID=2183934 RepID=UPI003A84994C
MYDLLIVEDDADLREAIEDTLELEGWSYQSVAHGQEALQQLKKHTFAALVSDVSMPVMDGHALLQQVMTLYPEMPMVLMTAYGSVGQAVEAMRLGAADYLVKPFVPETLVNVLRPLIEARVGAQPAQQGLVVEDPLSLQLLELAGRVAKSDASVMIGGESGTGKEVLARYIHAQSPRAQQPFVAINCAAIPENLLEATLFGYEKGAFTGAQSGAPGKFEQADGGTLLLDEITEMPLELQAKLLRVLQEQEVERLGSRKTLKLNVRVLATSNRHLKAAVQEGVFREDLYYRLNVFPLNWPPLRERRQDILPLARALLVKHAPRMGLKSLPVLQDCAGQRLMQHSWPGNVRELENVIQRALILSDGQRIPASCLVIEASEQEGELSLPPVMPSHKGQDDLRQDLKEQEFQRILQVLHEERGKKKETALRLGISPRTLRYKLAKMREEGYLIEE